MKEVTIKSKIVGRGGASAATSPGKGVSVDMSGYLLKQIWEKVFEFRLTDDGTEYLFAKMDMAVQGGITMYANGGNLDLPSIYDGLPLDNDTIYWEETKDEEGNVIARILKSRGVGEGGVADSVAWSNVTGKPTWIGNNKPSYTTSEVTEGTNLYFTNARAVTALGDTLKGYLPLTGGTITGDLRLRKGSEYTSPYLYFGDSDEVWLKEVTDTQLTIHADGSVKIDSPKTIIDGIEIKKSASGVLFIDANLVVSGGITMYGTDGTTANTIWDDAPIASTLEKGIASFDSNFFSVTNGHVTFIGSTGGGGVADSVAWGDVTGKPSWIGSSKPSYSYDEIDDTPTSLKNPNALSWSGYSSGSYDGSSAKGITIPNNTNQLTNGAGFITSSGTAAYAGALSTARTISLTGQATGSTTFDGSANKSIAVTIPTRNVRFNGTKYTVLTNSDTTDDMPNIYAADYAGTANQVCVSGGSGSAPSWVNQSAITSGACSGNAATATTASKLSTTSKTAWGQTYWTSGGVPTNINGDMSSVGHITPNAHNSRSVGAYDTSFLKVHANYLTSGASANNLLLVGGSSASYGIIFALNANGGNSGHKMAMGSNRLYPYTSLGMSLGSSYYLWNGIYLGYNNSSVYNDNGVMFGNGQARISANSDGSIGVLSKGYIYLRTKNPTSGSISSVGVDIDTSGNLLVTGGITMYSDLRKKTILNHVELSLKEVADAPLIEHYYNSDESKRTHVGSVAQYWAGLNDWFCKEDGEGFLTMEIQNAALASAISVARELTRYESETDKQIKKLKKRIGELEEEIENLKKV